MSKPRKSTFKVAPGDDWDSLPVQYDESTVEMMEVGEVKDLLRKYPPTYIGPTWATDDEGRFLLPKHTLGWQQAVWASKYLRGFEGQSWSFTPEQLRFLLWWKSIDSRGRFKHSLGVLQRCKGHGKDPFGMVDGIIEWVGPSMFDCFYQGQPIAKSNPASWVQFAAVSQSQTRNASALIPLLLPDSSRREFDLKVGLQLSRCRSTAQTLQMAASNPRSLEGNRVTYGVLDEPHHFLANNQGHAVYETIKRNTEKVGGRMLCITNAFMPGEDSTLENIRNDFKLVLESGINDREMLYDSVEAHPETPLDDKTIRAIFPVVRGDSTWLKVENVIPAIMSTTIPVSTSRRMWLNQITASDDALLTPELVSKVTVPAEKLEFGERIVLGFDGGRGDDSTALIACRVSDYTIFKLGVWQRPHHKKKGEWEAPEEEVDRYVRSVMESYDVVGFFADRALWESWIHQWERDYGKNMVIKASERKPIGWDMRGRVKFSTEYHETLLSAIERGHIRISDDPVLRDHMLNAVRRVNAYGVSFSKASPESPRKVDAYAAMMLAYNAALIYREKVDTNHSEELYIT